MRISKEIYLNTALFCLTVFIYCIPSILNGFPFLLSDSGTYLISGQTGDVPVDRPIIYGLFVRHMSLSWSIWLVLITQITILQFCLWGVVKYVLKVKKSFFIHFLLSVFLFVFTGVSYHSNLIIADIFTSISILSLILLFVIPRKNFLYYGLTIIILGFSLITHLSHIPLVLGILGIVFLVNLFKKGKLLNYKRILLSVSLVVLSLLTLATVNYSHKAGFKLSRIKYIVISARFIESGIANRFLKENCENGGADKPYSNLCNYIDKFGEWPSTGAYLWTDTSPLYDGPCVDSGGWSQCWIEKESNYEQLVNDILAVPKYRNDFIAQIVTGTLKQLVNFEQSKLDPTNLKWIVENYYEFDAYSHLNSTQIKKDILFDTSSLVEYITFDLSVLLILILLYYHHKKVSITLKCLLLCIAVGLLLNAAICSSLSNFVPRYQGRIVFLVPMSLFLLIIEVVKNKVQSKKLNLNDYLK